MSTTRMNLEQLQPPSILLAEDDDDFRSLLEDTLSHHGFAVKPCADGLQLLDEIVGCVFHDVNPPDLILTDVQMPGVDALQIVQGLRTLGWDMPVVVVSAFGDDDLRARVRTLGAYYFDKPVSLTDLESGIEFALHARPRDCESCANCDATEQLVPDPNAPGVAYCKQCLRSAQRQFFEDLGCGD